MKAPYELTVLAPQDWTVVSNMAPETEGGVDAGDGARSWHFPPTPLMATYITHVSAGPWHVVRAEHDGIPLGIFCRQSLAATWTRTRSSKSPGRASTSITRPSGSSTRSGSTTSSSCPSSRKARWRTPGAVTFLEDYVFRSRVTDFSREARGETILHEMAHMWFGDLVTMRWWDDLWLNESFATWAGTEAQAEATRWNHSWTTFTTSWKAWAYKQDQLPSTHPIAADIPDIHAVEVNFDGITYAKGAAVLKQLVAYVGYDNFLAGRARVLRRALVRATPRSRTCCPRWRRPPGGTCGTWSREWLETAGVNTLRPSYSVDADGRFTSFSVLQSAAPSHPTLRSHRIAIGLYSLTPEAPGPPVVRRDRRGRRLDPGARARRRAAARPGADQRRGPHLRQDPARPALPAHRRSRRSARSPRPCPPPWSGPRRGTWCRDGEMAARDYVRLVLGGVDSVRDISVVQTLLRQAILAARQYADPSWRAEGLAFIASALRSLFAAAAGRAPTTSSPTFARSPRWRPRPRTWSSWPGCLTARSASTGSRSTPTCAGRCCAAWSAGACAGEDAIDAELSRDATDAGERQAAGVPGRDPDAHRQARDLGDADRREADDRDVPRHDLRVRRPGPAGAGPALPAGVLRRARRRYGGSGPRRWRRTSWSTAYLICAVDEATIAATDAYLAAARRRPPRCAACSSRAATRSSAPCATSPATARRRARPVSPQRDGPAGEPAGPSRSRPLLGGSAGDRLGHCLADVLGEVVQGDRRPSRRWRAR